MLSKSFAFSLRNVAIRVATLLYFLLTAIAVSQPQKSAIQDNPFDKAPDLLKETERFQEERWFYEQRMFPRNYIPEGAYVKAMDQAKRLESPFSFYKTAVSRWQPIGPRSAIRDR